MYIALLLNKLNGNIRYVGISSTPFPDEILKSFKEGYDPKDNCIVMVVKTVQLLNPYA